MLIDAARQSKPSIKALPNPSASTDHDPARPPRLILIDAPFSPRLSRYIECLEWVAAGKSDADIARILELSAKTVYFHVDGAKRRINASSRSHAVASAIRLGLFT